MSQSRQKPIPDEPYSLVHVVSDETMKDLIVPQVVLHMLEQLKLPGLHRPADVSIVFLEPARVTARSAVRARVRAMRRQAPGVRVILMPQVSRFSARSNTTILGPLLRLRVGNRPTVFHCRGESAVEWAHLLKRYFRRAEVVADIRGALPEEFLFDRGFDTVAEADAASREEYERCLARVRAAIGAASAILSVSPDMLEWLHGVGAGAETLDYVPCCVPEIRYSPSDRQRVRRELRLDGKLVLVYLGSVVKYQHVDDGVLPFFRAVASECADAHLLCLTNDRDRMAESVDRAALAADRVSILGLPHDEIAAHLCAADAGLLLRAPSRMNRFSRPTKLAEYLSCGLPVILSKGMGQTDRLIEEAGAGVLVDAFTDDGVALRMDARRVVHALRTDGSKMRERALRLCEQEFLWRCYADRVRAVYRRILDA